MKKQIAIALGMLAVSAMADVTLDGPTFVTSNTTVSEKVTGNGYYVVQSGATLTLSGEGNDFTGGVIISNGVLKAQSNGAFGTGPIAYEGTAAQRMVQLDVTNGSFPNAFTIRDTGTTSTYPAIYLTKSASIGGDIALDQSMPSVSAAYIYLKVGASASDTGVQLTANGETLAGDGRIFVTGWGKVDFVKRVTTSDMRLGNAYSEHGSITLRSPDNEIARLVQAHFDVECTADYVLNRTSYQLNFNKAWGHAGYATMKLNGTCQNFQYANCGSDCDIDFSEAEKWGEMFYNNNNQKVSTITFNAEGMTSASGICVNRFYGNMNIVMENKFAQDTGTYYQAFQGRDNSGMVGNISIGNRCQFRVFNGCRFGGVTNLTVESGGFITYENRSGKTTPVGRTFTGLQTLTLKGTAFIRTDYADTVEPVNSPKANLYMDADSRIYLSEGVTMTVKKLYIDGELMAAGEYTSENLPQMKYKNATYNGGVLKVLRGPGSMILVR